MAVTYDGFIMTFSANYKHLYRND